MADESKDIELLFFNSKIRSYIIPRLSEVLEGHPISTWDVTAMGIIWDYPGCNIKEICTRVGADKGRMTILIRKLIESGMVENRSTGKSYELYLTVKGTDEYTFAKRNLNLLNEELKAGLTTKQKETLNKLLEKIVEVADEGYRYRRYRSSVFVHG